MSGIYIIFCLVNEHFYVGSSQSLKIRWNRHKNELNKNIHKNKHLQRSWNKYGSQNFKWFKLELVEDVNKLIEREQYWMDLLKPEFNNTKSASSTLGHKHTEETKLKMSIKRKGVPKSDNFKILISIANKNRIISQETKDKISKKLTGKKISQETKDKMANSKRNKPSNMLGKAHSEETKKIMSENKKGINNSFYGKTHSEETKRKIIETRMKNKLLKENA